jgi:hypothetical protein
MQTHPSPQPSNFEFVNLRQQFLTITNAKSKVTWVCLYIVRWVCGGMLYLMLKSMDLLQIIQCCCHVLLSLIQISLGGATMDWKNGRKPVSFRKNQRNRSRPVLPVFSKPAGEFEIFKKIEIKNSKQNYSQFQDFWSNQNSKLWSDRGYKIRRRGNQRKTGKKKKMAGSW